MSAALVYPQNDVGGNCFDGTLNTVIKLSNSKFLQSRLLFTVEKGIFENGDMQTTDKPTIYIH